jgi:hypothetical protein
LYTGVACRMLSMIEISRARPGLTLCCESEQGKEV